MMNTNLEAVQCGMRKNISACEPQGKFLEGVSVHQADGYWARVFLLNLLA